MTCTPGSASCWVPATSACPYTAGRGISILYRAIYNKYFVDEFYDSTVVRPLVDGSRTLLWRTADAGLIDGTVNGIGKTARAVGGILKRTQSGFIRDYAAWVVAGSIAVILAMALWGGVTGGAR